MVCFFVVEVSSKVGVYLILDKRIFIVVGVGGGFFDVVVVFRGLNKFWFFGLGENEILDLVVFLGVDVFVCFW